MNQPQTEQRIRNPRARISELIYMTLQSGNGGILVDVSRTGLGFQAAEPIDTTAPVNFKIAAGAIGTIELTGELIWTDRARKRGGLRFGHVPIEVRQQIQNWLDPPNTAVAGNHAGRNQFGHEDFSRAMPAIPKVPRVAHDAHDAMHLYSSAATQEAPGDEDANGAQARIAQARDADARIAQFNDTQLDDWNINEENMRGTEAASAPLVGTPPIDTAASDPQTSHVAPSRSGSDEIENLVADRADTNSASAPIDAPHAQLNENDGADAALHRLSHGSTKFSDAKLGDPKIVDANFSVPRHGGPAHVGATAGPRVPKANGDATSGTALCSKNFGPKPSDMKPDAKVSADARPAASVPKASANLGDTDAKSDAKPDTIVSNGAKPDSYSSKPYVGPLGIPLRTPSSSSPLSEQAAGYRATLNPRSIFVSDQEFKARLRAFESSQRRRRGRITAIAAIIAILVILAGGSYLYQRRTGSSIVQLAENIAGRGNANANNSKYADDNGALSSFSSNDSGQSPVQSLAPSLAMSPSLAAPQPQAPTPATERGGNSSAENNSSDNKSGDAFAGGAGAGNSAIGGASSSALNQNSAPAASARKSASVPAKSSASTSTSTFAGTAQSQPPASGTHPVVPSVAPSAVPAESGRRNSALNAGYAATRSPSEPPNGTDAANSRSLEGGSADLALANRYLQSGSSNDRAVGAQLLWTAVGEGNTQAELELADLYLRGDAGLSKNCTQARVLLMAASESYSPVAQEKLADLSAYGCK